MPTTESIGSPSVSMISTTGIPAAASMARDEDVVQLRANVTSKKGTTDQAIRSFEADGLQRLVNNATAAAHRRSLELARELTGK